MSRSGTDFDSLLHNLSVYGEHFSTPEEGIERLRGKESQLEVVHIYLDYINSEAYGKKEYFEISRYNKLTKLDEWIFEHLIDQDKYRKNKFNAC